jgi:hypothetical protein
MANKQRFCCTLCGTSFTRKSSCRDHARKLHSGNGYPVTETEYIIGRQSGCYFPPLPLLAQKPAFAPAEKEVVPKHTFPDEFAKEFWMEKARMSARNVSSRAQAPNNSAMTGLPSIEYSLPSPKLFGLEVYLCHKCLATELRILSLSQLAGSGIATNEPRCSDDGKDLLANVNMTREQYIASSSNRLPEYLKSCILNAFPPNHGIIMLVADISNLPQDRHIVTISCKTNSGKSHLITLPYPEEKCLRFNPASAGNWALRAIEDKRTIINEHELSEFLAMTKTSTFGFFKQEEKSAAKVYFFTLAIDDEGNAIQSVTLNA